MPLAAPDMPKPSLTTAPPFCETGYDPASPVYDLEYPECDGAELEFWIAQGRRFGPRLLEFAVGTGRIAVPLAQRGFQVTGVDTSAAMLARAAARRAGLPRAGRAGLRLHRGDMRNCRLEQAFDLVFVGFNSYLLLPDQAARRQALQNAAAHVRSGGGVAVDVFSATALDATPDHEEVEFLERDPVTGWRITRERFYTYDPAAHRGCSTLIYRYFDGPAIVDERRLGYSLALLTRDDVVAEFVETGLEIDGVCGDYTFQPWRDDSPNLLVIGRTAAR